MSNYVYAISAGFISSCSLTDIADWPLAGAKPALAEFKPPRADGGITFEFSEIVWEFWLFELWCGIR